MAKNLFYCLSSLTLFYISVNSPGRVIGHGSRLMKITDSNSPDAYRRITDGTGNVELNKAASTYLNRTGAADYNLPKLTGEKIMQSNKKNSPSHRMY